MKRRLFCLLLCALLLPALPGPGRAAHAEEAAPDGADAFSGTAAEAASYLRRAQSGTTADLTGNGVCDGGDAAALLLHALGALDGLDGIPDALAGGSLPGERFLDKFCYGGGVDITENGYRSERVSVTVARRRVYLDGQPVMYFLADIYVRNLACLRTALAEDTFGRADAVERIAADAGAIIAISGDYYSARERSLVIRNGETYRTSVSGGRDVCVLYADGTMAAYDSKTADVAQIVADGAWQAWNFGPMLLTADGQPMQKFNTNVATRNPRSAIGYYEPGHYCFLVVDGRSKGYSVGITMAQLSELFYALGCKAAYNLDGGATAVMATASGALNEQTDTRRECSDILYIIDTDEFITATAAAPAA